MPTCVGTDLPPSALRGLELDERLKELDDSEDHPERDGEYVHRQHLPSEGAAPAREADRRLAREYMPRARISSAPVQKFIGYTCSFVQQLGQLAYN